MRESETEYCCIIQIEKELKRNVAHGEALYEERTSTALTFLVIYTGAIHRSVSERRLSASPGNGLQKIRPDFGPLLYIHWTSGSPGLNDYVS